MILREEKPADRKAIRDVVTAAFGTTAEATLIDHLRNDGDIALSLVAEMPGDRIVGHILFSPLTAPFRALALAPVAVTPNHQRQGIGSRLIREGLVRAARDGWQGVFVLGDPGYYRRFGFNPELAAGFRCPYAGPYLMVAALNGTLPAMEGVLRYARAFENLA
jgi:putative acetyltransferase